MSNLKIGILIFGGLCEFAGIILTAAPELYPRLTPTGEKVSQALHVVATRIRRAFGRPKSVVYGSAVSGGIRVGGHASGIVGVGEEASLERKLTFLLEQAAETQRHFDKLERRLADLPQLWKDEIEAAKGEIAALIETKLAEERNAYIRSRLLGLTRLAIGLPMVFVANFID